MPLLFIAEGYDVAHVALGHQWTTYGGFILLGYAVGRFTPYVEVERIASKGGTDPFFIPDSPWSRWTFPRSIRWKGSQVCAST